jgi:hypothetical protein
MPREASAAHSHSTLKDQVVDLYKDFEHEVKLEANNPVESPQGDLPVRKHVNGLTITFFILIALSVLGAMVGYALYTHY